MCRTISRLLERADSDVRDAWRDVDDSLARLADEVAERYTRGSYSGRRDDYRRDDSRGSGYLRWRGRVDGSDCVVVRGDRVTVRHTAANPRSQEWHDLGNPLPQRPVDLRLNRLRGRGRVQLARQPSSSNGYTAEVCIDDDKGGDALYEFELTW